MAKHEKAHGGRLADAATTHFGIHLRDFWRTFNVMPEEELNLPLVEVARYPRLAQAREHSLALAAKDLAYTIERDGDEWVLSVEERVATIAQAELESVRAEEERKAASPPQVTFEKIRPLSLFVAGWLLSGFFFAQQILGPQWTMRGEADNDAILHRGEWWRTITALTLHGDGSHLTANLTTGLLFAAFLLPQLGTGLTWSLIVATGALGNAVNAWGYRGEPHHSIGASTAVFGALGMLVGTELWERWSSPVTRTRWQLVLPLGAGLSLLAYLGVGDKQGQIDYMAHFWGFMTGILMGGAAAALHLKQRLSESIQRAIAIAVPLLIAWAWWSATHR